MTTCAHRAPNSRNTICAASSPTPTPLRAVKFSGAVLIGDGCLHKDVAGHPFEDALPQKRRARPLGADVGGRLYTSCLAVCQDPEVTISAASSPTPTPVRAVKFNEAPYDYAVNVCAMTLRAFLLRTRCPRSATPNAGQRTSNRITRVRRR
jgi:hypothetical protein